MGKLTTNKYSTGGGVFHKRLSPPRKRKEKKVLGDYTSIFIVSLFIAVISLSVGYASLSSSLLVSGEAHLRVKEEVRVTNLTISEQISSSYDNNSEYYKNGLILRAVLPNKDSKITYTVELTNNSSVDYYLKSAGYKSIEENSYTEIDKNTMTFEKGDFKYTITGIKTDDTVIKPNKSTFTITITYKDGLQEVPSNNNAVIDIRYEFDILDKIPPVVTFSPNGGCYGGAQVVRVTGYDEHFNHMEIEVYKNGEKIEEKTVTYPNNSYDISLNEYTGYTIYVKAYDDRGNVQTIGPQDNRGHTYQKYLIEEDSEYLYDKVKTCAVSDENVDFSKQPTNEEAEQAYYIDTKPIYYYRGPVENNNVIFGGYCWKIVRTTETGGIKLLYSGTPTSDGKCTATKKDQFAFRSSFNTQASSVIYAGYMYGDNDISENKYDSAIKTNLEAWYDGTLKTDEDGYAEGEYYGHTTGELTKTYPGIKEYEGFLEDAIWCNDRTIGSTKDGYYGTYIYYAAHDRNTTYDNVPSPSLTCSINDSFTVSSENGNGKSKYKVGLITADELTMGGMTNNNVYINNINTYLYTGDDDYDNSWWSLSPSHWDAEEVGSQVSVFAGFQGLRGDYTHAPYGVRPMVSLQNSVEVETSGNGTTNNPYKVITDGASSGKKLYDTMLSSAKEIVSDVNVDFSKDPTNEDANRLYYVDEGYPIYYYRGPVTNNNVIFGGYCWKIVRTTETGGIKLLYSGKPTNGKCTATKEEQFAFKSAFNSTYSNKKYVGYMYGEDDKYENIEDSTIKKNIEAWFEGKSTNAAGDPNGSLNPNYTDLTKFDNYLEDAVWCNDRTEGSVNETTQYYAGYDRAKSFSPSLACPSNDSFTKSIENGNGATGEKGHKVGLITVDELTMGGLNWNTNRNSSNINTYLYTGNSAYWWSLSPSAWFGDCAYVFLVCDTLNYSNVYHSNGVRPMVSLVHDIKTYTGDGTAESPYVIVDNYYDNMKNSGTINATANTDYIHFDGVDDYWSLGLDNYDFSDGFTLSIRFKLNEYKDSTQHILGNWETCGGGLFINERRRVVLRGWFGDNVFRDVFGPEIELNEWYTAIATYEGGLLSLYVYSDALENGGGFIASSNYQGKFTKSSQPITIGANPESGKLFIDCASMDVREVAIYNRALSSEEIAKGFKEDINIKAVSDDKLLKYVDYKYMKFDGVDDYATMGLEDYDFSDGFTWGIRVKLNEYKTTNQNIFGNLNTSGGTISISNYENALHGLFYIDGEYRVVVGEAPKLNRWYTVTYTYEKEKNLFSLYVDGKPVKTLEYPGTLVNSSQPFAIGANPDPGNKFTEYANIDVRQAVIYGRALQEQEIKDTLSDEIKVINDDKLLRYINFSE